MCYVSGVQKFETFYSGSIVQKFPETIPGRKYVSSAVADALKLPYTEKDALRKFDQLMQNSLETWGLDEKIHAEQMKNCIALIELCK